MERELGLDHSSTDLGRHQADRFGAPVGEQQPLLVDSHGARPAQPSPGPRRDSGAALRCGGAGPARGRARRGLSDCDRSSMVLGSSAQSTRHRGGVPPVSARRRHRAHRPPSGSGGTARRRARWPSAAMPDAVPSSDGERRDVTSLDSFDRPPDVPRARRCFPAPERGAVSIGVPVAVDPPEAEVQCGREGGFGHAGVRGGMRRCLGPHRRARPPARPEAAPRRPGRRSTVPARRPRGRRGVRSPTRSGDSGRCGVPPWRPSCSRRGNPRTPGAPATAAHHAGATTASTVFSATDSTTARAMPGPSRAAHVAPDQAWEEAHGRARGPRTASASPIDTAMRRSSRPATAT